jgi:hypothetical protein
MNFGFLGNRILDPGPGGEIDTSWTQGGPYDIFTQG